MVPILSPTPKKISARAGPTIAVPVSCAMARWRNDVSGYSLAIGSIASIQIGVP
jgi:hypothetical protein